MKELKTEVGEYFKLVSTTIEWLVVERDENANLSSVSN